MDEMSCMPVVGDRVRVVTAPHMPGQTEGVVRQVVGYALGIEFDNAPGTVHQWYVPTEVMVTEPAVPPEPPDDAMEGKGGRYAFRVPNFPRAAEYVGLWAILPSAAEDLARLVAATDLAEHMKAGPPRVNPTLSLEPGVGGRSVAHIAVRGTLMKGQSSFGGTSTVQLRRDIRQAVADPNVSGILLNVESPGGTVAGTADLAAEVKAARKKKPVWAQVEDLGASAAYWVASQADQIFANDRTALVGSIGTVLTVYDQSAMAQKEGIRTLVFATGPLKGAGTPGAPVTPEQQAYFQGIVNSSQASFDAAVRSGRGMTAAELEAVKTGGVFTADRALELKLIDGIRSTDRTLEALARAK